MCKPNFYWFFYLFLATCGCLSLKKIEIYPSAPALTDIYATCIDAKSDKKRQSTFPFDKADTIKVFSYPADVEVDSNHSWTTLVPESVEVTEVKETIVLNTTQIDSLFSIFYDTKRQGTRYGAPSCYSPRHCIVFYEGKKVLAFFEICFHCFRVKSSPNVDFGELCGDKLCKFQKFFKQIGIQYEINSENCP
jgi:hypothetical protein